MRELEKAVVSDGSLNEMINLGSEYKIQRYTIPEIENKRIAHIIQTEKCIEIHFDDATVYLLTHAQECCEDVYIESVDPDFEKDEGARLLRLEEYLAEAENKPTYTFYRIITDKMTYVVRFFGESNGYYSENASVYAVYESEDPNFSAKVKRIDKIFKRSTAVSSARITDLCAIYMLQIFSILSHVSPSDRWAPNTQWKWSLLDNSMGRLVKTIKNYKYRWIVSRRIAFLLETADLSNEILFSNFLRRVTDNVIRSVENRDELAPDEIADVIYAVFLISKSVSFEDWLSKRAEGVVHD